MGVTIGQTVSSVKYNCVAMSAVYACIAYTITFKEVCIITFEQ